MDITQSKEEMERTELPKLKKAVISLKKLDLLPKMPVSGGEIKGKQRSASTLEDSEEPSSENVSIGSAELNVMGTDDDDLEKKIQAFSIPVNKEEEKTSSKKEDKTNNKSNSDKSTVLEKGSESIKTGKKVTFSLSKSDTKSKEKARFKMDVSLPTEKSDAAMSEVDTVSRDIRKKKENITKKKDKADNEEEKQLSLGNRQSAVKEQEPCDTGNKKPNLNGSCNKSPLTHSIRNGKDDKKRNEKKIERKTKKDHCDDTVESATESEVSRKRKAQRKENTQVPSKKVLIEKKSSILSPEPSTSASVKEKNQSNIEIKLRSDSTKKKKMLSKRLLVSGSPLNVKRSLRISNAANILKTRERKNKRESFGNKIQKKITQFKKSSDNQQKSKDVAKKIQSHSEDRTDVSSKLKMDDTRVEKKMKEKTEKRTSIMAEKKPSHNVLTPKDEYAKTISKVTGWKKNSKQITAVSDKVNKSSTKVQKLQKESNRLDKNLQKSSTDVFDDGEELLERICDILEDASRIPETSGGEKRNFAQKLYSHSQRTVSSSKERFLIPDPSFFKPKILHKSPRFPSHGKGTVSYKKLWKWSHYVKMPSDMWSLHKHPDGNFVIVFHISEMSPFPKLVIDKCIIFKETASPCVKIYGKDVLALSSKNELQTLGNVCSFLKHIHDISLCEGVVSPSGGESNNNCELYTDGKVSLPYKCKSCL